MGIEFESYLEILELIAFFSGFPLIYAVVQFIAGTSSSKSGFSKRLTGFLPYSYGLSGILFLGYLLKNFYPDYSFAHIRTGIHHYGLVLWGILSILFLVPLFSKRPVFSLIHSLVFFFLFIKDLFPGSKDKHVIANNMKVYTDSLLLQAAAYIAIVLGYYAITWLFRKKNS